MRGFSESPASDTCRISQQRSPSRNVRTNQDNMRVVHNACQKSVRWSFLYTCIKIRECVTSESEEGRADTPRRGYQKRQPRVRGGMMRMCAGWIQNDKDYRRMTVMGIMKNGADDGRWMWGNFVVQDVHSGRGRMME